jgi:hypothetical protein
VKQGDTFLCYLAKLSRWRGLSFSGEVALRSFITRRGRPQKPQSEHAMILKAGTQIE